uniref:Zf-BED domain-containing protein n=1 Tax=Tanacetum cinerariifolium TaxID=118510 RepID=A0A699GI70_TANCI|nr:zf-BED domain-containing protein [Tanacetum cinerariifolium]
MYSPFGKVLYLEDKDTFEEEYKIESEVFELLKISDDLFSYDTPFEIVFNEFRRLSSMEDNLFPYKLGVVEDSYFLCIEQPHDNLKNDDLDVYEPRVCYDENKQIYAEVVILINKRLARLIDITAEQWLDLNFRDHKKVNKEIMEELVSTWLVTSYRKQFVKYIGIKRRLEVYRLYTDMECDSFNVDFAELLASKFSNHMTMDWYTKNALWLYCTRVVQGLEDGDLKDEALKEKSILEGSWGHENREGNNFCSWLKECFCNYYELDCELIRKLKEYWWGKKEEEESSEDAWSDYSPDNDNDAIQTDQERFDNHKPLEDDDIIDLYGYLIPQDASYYVDEEEERFKERKSKLLGMPYEKASTFKSEKFEVIKYSLGPTEEYVAIKEYEARGAGFVWERVVEVIGSSGKWARGAGFMWERVVEVMGSSGKWWSGAGIVGKGVTSLAGGFGVNSNRLNVGGERQEESIDSGFARFNTIITSPKALDEDELIGNLKVHEVIMEKDSEIYRGEKERVKSIALKANKESSDDETSTSRSDDEEYAMTVRNFKKLFKRKGKFVRQLREEKKSFRQRDEKKGKSDQN